MGPSVTNYVGVLFQALKDRITDAGIGVLHQDYFNDQVGSEGSHVPFNRPALLYAFRIIDNQRLGHKRYAALIEFDVIVVTDMLGTARTGASVRAQNKAMEHLNLHDKVLYLLDGFRSEAKGFGSISLVRTELSNDFDQVIAHVLTFKTRMITDAAVRSTTVVDPSLVITPDIEEL